MARRFGVMFAAAIGVAMLAGCGGQAAPGSTDGPDGTQGGSGTTPGPVATTTGGGTGDACALLTPEEVAGATASEPLTATPSGSDPATCTYTLADGTTVLTVDRIGTGAAGMFQTFIDAGSADSVEGIGDAALYEPGTRRLLVLTGGQLVMLSSGPFVDGADLDGLAHIAVARQRGQSPDTQITAPPVVTAETACELLTGDEAAAIVGKGPMEAQENEFAPQFCTYVVISSGEGLLSTYIQFRGGAADWAGLEASLTTEPVAGLGDKAMFEPSTGILFVLKSDSILNVNVFGLAPAEALALDRQLAEIMIGRI